MTIEERNKRILLAIDKHTKHMLSLPKDEIRKYLISLGIYTPQGELKE